jgi:hypothetical protein
MFLACWSYVGGFMYSRNFDSPSHLHILSCSRLSEFLLHVVIAVAVATSCACTNTQGGIAWNKLEDVSPSFKCAPVVQDKYRQCLIADRTPSRGPAACLPPRSLQQTRPLSAGFVGQI